jgi:DNA repair protein RadA/Sms
MAKIKSSFFCKNCGSETAKWVGRCPACGEWNTVVEEVVATGKESAWKAASSLITNNKEKSKPVKLVDIVKSHTFRIPTDDEEFNRVLGGGIVPGSITLIGGEPGIGKSTLLLQVALNLPQKLLYITGEESLEQIKMRADRVGNPSSECYIYAETNTQRIFEQIKAIEPDILVIDSIQTVFTELLDATPGSISQIRECAGQFQRLAKETNIPVILVGHINKEGEIAGPKLLEHIVDTVLQFEGDRNFVYRILRTIKNRFGSTSEIGVYEMEGRGLRPVSNPSEILMSQRDEALSGISIGCTMEGNRPFMLESQALVSNAVYGNPQRSATGFDVRRMNMLLAVLEKRAGFSLGNKDVFLNIAGGIKVTDPSMDLAVVCALMSSYEDTEISNKVSFAGEIGLSGEIRAVNKIEQRIEEAEKLGFEKIFISKYNKKGLNFSKFHIKVEMVGKVLEVYQKLF